MYTFVYTVNCSLLDTSSSGAFDNKLRRTMTSPYISSTADVAVGSSDKSLPSFAFTVVIPFYFHLVLWRSGRTLVFDRRAFAVLRSTYS